MNTLIILRKGLRKFLSTNLLNGEPAWAYDQKVLYMGYGNRRRIALMSSSWPELGKVVYTGTCNFTSYHCPGGCCPPEIDPYFHTFQIPVYLPEGYELVTIQDTSFETRNTETGEIIIEPNPAYRQYSINFERDPDYLGLYIVDTAAELSEVAEAELKYEVTLWYVWNGGTFY